MAREELKGFQINGNDNFFVICCFSGGLSTDVGEFLGHVVASPTELLEAEHM